MSRQEAAEQYEKALKRGRKTYREAVLRGHYPYPQVLDEILSENMAAGQVELGIHEIPANQIIGTKTHGRQNSFAADFMPLLEADSEFAAKWMDLCRYHLGDEGIRDPVRCYEYLGRFYVQEGNKRVSVLKSFDAPTVPAYVIRVIPEWSMDPEIQAYYEFMRAYELTGLYRICFSRPGRFGKLQAALGYELDHVWTDEERRAFTAGFTGFQQAFEKLGGEELDLTPADALLVWLKVYPFSDLRKSSNAELLKTLRSVWADVKAVNEEIAVSTEPEEFPSSEPNLLSRLFKTKLPTHLNIAFFSDHLPEESDWARAHDLGRQYMEAVLSDAVTVQAVHGVQTEEEAVAAMEEAVEQGAQVIFATTPPLIGACRKIAAQHPGLRVLNCSVSMPYTGVRTYYSRIYEAKFITGAIAGALCRDGVLGYVASNPIFGVPAGINAFALGAQLTCPDARIKLRWSCVEEDAMEKLAQEGVTLISNRDLPTPDRICEPWGLCQVHGGSVRSLAAPYWHWGNFYVKLVRSIFSGGWEALSAKQDKAVNYWWGVASRTVDILPGEDLPAGVWQLAEILRHGVAVGSIFPFLRPLRDQSGRTVSDGSRWLTPEEILHMDWLCDCVEGKIPTYEQLLPMARPLARLQGVYRDAIPPEKEGPIL